MSKIHSLLVLSLAMLPFSAIGETYKCRSPDGKISYAGQMSLTPGVKCEQMFVKKQSVVVQEAPPTVPDAGSTAEFDPRNPPPPNEGDAQPPSTGSKKPDATTKKTEPDPAKKKTEKAAQDKSAADKLAEQKLKEENCQNAKTNLRTYQAGGRISKVNESGEKIPMSDAEIQQKTEEAQKEVDKWCAS